MTTGTRASRLVLGLALTLSVSVSGQQISLQPNPKLSGLWMTGAAVHSAVRPTSLDGEVWVPRDVRELQVRWDISKIRTASGVLWQATRVAFPTPDPNNLETLHALQVSRSGVLRGTTGTFTIRLDELATRAPALRASTSSAPSAPRFYVRVIPIATPPGNQRKPAQFVKPGMSPIPNVITVGQPSPALVVNHRAADCAEMPEACCPTRDMCATLAKTLLDIRVRSYVPPRFSVMGRHDQYAAPNLGWANIVSDVDRTDVGVRKGCRFYPVAIVERLRRNMSVWEEFTSLGEAVLKQWGQGYAAAKSFVASSIAAGVCEGVGNPSGCRGQVQAWAATGIDIGLASLGIPPEIPDLEQLRQHGIQYLASMAASAAVGQSAAVFGELPMGDVLYDRVYREASDGLARELDRALPSTRVESSNPMTWGRIDPAYRPHNARLYLEVRVREGRAAALARVTKARGASIKLPILSFEDRKDIFADRASITLPAVIPGNGLLVPLELIPSMKPSGSGDDAKAAIPGTPISRKWLQERFKLDGTLATAQNNYLPHVSTNYLGSDYDLFYQSNGQYEFALTSKVGGETIVWEEKRTGRPGSVWDVVTGIGARTGSYFDRVQNMKKYYGLIEPAPRCDGQPNLPVTR